MAINSISLLLKYIKSTHNSIFAEQRNTKKRSRQLPFNFTFCKSFQKNIILYLIQFPIGKIFPLLLNDLFWELFMDPTLFVGEEEMVGKR
jgi:hypothetical protein